MQQNWGCTAGGACTGDMLCVSISMLIERGMRSNNGNKQRWLASCWLLRLLSKAATTQLLTAAPQHDRWGLGPTCMARPPTEAVC